MYDEDGHNDEDPMAEIEEAAERDLEQQAEDFDITNNY